MIKISASNFPIILEKIAASIKWLHPIQVGPSIRRMVPGRSAVSPATGTITTASKPTGIKYLSREGKGWVTSEQVKSAALEDELSKIALKKETYKNALQKSNYEANVENKMVDLHRDHAYRNIISGREPLNSESFNISKKHQNVLEKRLKQGSLFSDKLKRYTRDSIRRAIRSKLRLL